MIITLENKEYRLDFHHDHVPSQYARDIVTNHKSLSEYPRRERTTAALLQKDENGQFVPVTAFGVELKASVVRHGPDRHCKVEARKAALRKLLSDVSRFYRIQIYKQYSEQSTLVAAKS